MRFQDFRVAGVVFRGLLIGCLCFLVIKVFLGALSSLFGVPQEVFINFMLHQTTLFIGTPKNHGKTYCKYVIDITSIEYRFEIIRTISKPFTFKTTHKNVG